MIPAGVAKAKVVESGDFAEQITMKYGFRLSARNGLACVVNRDSAGPPER